MRVGVIGSAGKMGRTVCAAVADDPAMTLVAGVDPTYDEEHTSDGVRFSSSIDVLTASGADVAVDFTRPDAVMADVRACVERSIHCVVGTSGLSERDHDAIRALLSDDPADGSANVFIAPNFSIGAVLMMHFARLAAPHLGSCEIVEIHHNEKLDAPSGTARATAHGVADVWAREGRPAGGEPAPGESETVEGARGADVDGVRVHSLRLRGALAHQEVVFGGPGQTLSIRHDSLDRDSFMPGVLLAIREVGARRGLTVGLEVLLGLTA